MSEKFRQEVVRDWAETETVGIEGDRFLSWLLLLII